MTRTRLETNFIRLLEQSKSMANSGRHTEWRFEKFVTTLEEQLTELRKGPMQPEKDVLDEYARSLQFLKGLIITEKLPSATEKVAATQFLSPCPSPYADPVSQGIKHKVAAQYSNEVRDELLSNQTMKLDLDNSKENREQDNKLSTLRQRRNELLNTARSNATDRDFDAIMKHEQSTQEDLTANMLYLAKALKEQASTSSMIIRQDVSTLQKSNTLAEENDSKLQTHSQKLREKTGWCARWIQYLCLVLAIFMFIGMVMLMKFFKKPVQ